MEQFVCHLKDLMNIKGKHDQDIKIKGLPIDMSPVMRQIIAIIFQRIKTFVFHLPSCSGSFGDAGHRCGIDTAHLTQGSGPLFSRSLKKYFRNDLPIFLCKMIEIKDNQAGFSHDFKSPYATKKAPKFSSTYQRI